MVNGKLPRLDDVQAIVSDVDGTLLTDFHAVHSRTITAVRRLKSLRPNIPFILASGKQISSCDPVRDSLDVPIQAGNGAIHCNGTVIYSPQSSSTNGDGKPTVFLEKGIPLDLLFKLIDHLKGKATFLFDREWVYLVQDYDPSDGGYKDWLGEVKRYDKMVMDCRKDGEREKLLNKIRKGDIVIVKMSVAAEPEEMNDIREYILSLFPPEIPIPVVIARAVPFILEVMPEGVSKASALLELLAHHTDSSSGTPINPANVIAFGDGENDIPLLSSVGYGVVMGNAMPEVKNELRKLGNWGEYVTDTNDEAGVATFLEKIMDASEGDER